MSEYVVAPLERLIEQFERLPGIGHKTAVRLAYYVLSMSESEVEKFSSAVVDAHKKIRYCKICFNLTDRDVCPICSDDKRDKSIICVVQDPKDVMAFEKTREFNAEYHVLHGLLSPRAGSTPDMIHTKELLKRLGNNEVKEVIMAMDGTVEGEATAVYLSKLIKPLGIKVTRLAYGIPVGADLQYADEVTLSKSLSGRVEL